jgi:hypothetical protein
MGAQAFNAAGDRIQALTECNDGQPVDGVVALPTELLDPWVRGTEDA